MLKSSSFDLIEQKCSLFLKRAAFTQLELETSDSTQPLIVICWRHNANSVSDSCNSSRRSCAISRRSSGIIFCIKHKLSIFLGVPVPSDTLMYSPHNSLITLALVLITGSSCRRTFHCSIPLLTIQKRGFWRDSYYNGWYFVIISPCINISY